MSRYRPAGLIVFQRRNTALDFICNSRWYAGSECFTCGKLLKPQRFYVRQPIVTREWRASATSNEPRVFLNFSAVSMPHAPSVVSQILPDKLITSNCFVTLAILASWNVERSINSCEAYISRTSAISVIHR